MAVGTDQVVVVTGASAGVGRAAACAFAQRHARVAPLARGERGLEAAAEDVLARGVDARWGSPRMSPIRNR